MYIKQNWEMEFYLNNLDTERKLATHTFEIGNHRQQIETGRYVNLPEMLRNCARYNAYPQ